MLREFSDRPPEPEKRDLPFWFWIALTTVCSFILIDVLRWMGVPI